MAGFTKDFIRHFDFFKTKDSHTVFANWVEMAAISMLNRCRHSTWDDKEKRYLEIAKQYTAVELSKFVEMLAELWGKLIEEPYDYLGTLASEMNVLSIKKGQFFTPYEVSCLVAKLTFQGFIFDREITTINEPTCGSGGMIIATTQVLQEYGREVKDIVFIAQDIDRLCVLMTYLQLSILNVPAIVIWGNTLTCEVYEQWPTFPIYSDGKYLKELRNIKN